MCIVECIDMLAQTRPHSFSLQELRALEQRDMFRLKTFCISFAVYLDNSFDQVFLYLIK